MKNFREKTFIETAKLLAQHSTCIRVNVGCLIVKNDRILSTGYNGVSYGQQHCEDHFNGYDISTDEFKKLHAIFSDENEIHAEINSIIYAAKNGIKIDGGTMYCTHSPCTNCSKAIVASGIKEVIYEILYDRDPIGIEFLLKNNINVRPYNLNKYISTYPFICKNCGKGSDEVELICDSEDYCICKQCNAEYHKEA
jgi:dCMP deaminase